MPVTYEDLKDVKFVFDAKLALKHADDVDQELARDIHLKNVRFNTHEFIKVNKVSSLISEAIEAIVERLNTKDKLTAANKAMIRNMDTKQKHMETSINQLLKLNK